MNEAQLHSLPIPSLVVRKLISAISISTLEPWDLNFRVIQLPAFVYLRSNWTKCQVYLQCGRHSQVFCALGINEGKLWRTRWKLLHPGWNPSNWDCGGRPPKGSHEGDLCVVFGILSNWKTTSRMQRTKPSKFCEVSDMRNWELQKSYTSIHVHSACRPSAAFVDVQ